MSGNRSKRVRYEVGTSVGDEIVSQFRAQPRWFKKLVLSPSYDERLAAPRIRAKEDELLAVDSLANRIKAERTESDRAA